MIQSNFKLSFKISAILILLLVIVSSGGLLLPDLYLDSETIKTVWQGNDLVTLIVVVPLFIASLAYAKRKDERAYLLWMGLLAYTIYNYAFYVFGAAFNKFFLLYVIIFSLSIYGIIIGLSGLNIKEISMHFSSRLPVKWISIFLLFISLPLALFEGFQCISFILTGRLPEAPTLIFALDLSIVVPNSLLAAWLLLKHHPWGYVLGCIMLVKAFAYGLVLCIGTTLVAFNPAGSWDPLMPFYIFLVAGGLISLLGLLKNLKTSFKPY
jgi:hypothetical protein